jgi:hypothetical protein
MKELQFLPLLNAALATDLIWIALLLLGIIPSFYLGEWYRSFGIGAFLSDVLILMIGVLITYYIYPYVFGTYHIGYFAILAVGVQLIHDLLFGLLLPRKTSSPILRIFQRYISEHGFKILLADALMILSTVGLEHVFSGALSSTQEIIVLIGLGYLTPYLVFSV